MNMPVGRLIRTVRHLKPVQLWGRAAHVANWTRPDLRPPPPRRARTGLWVTPVGKAACMCGPTRLRFLNHTGTVERANDWQAGQELLWLYNLHYFDDLLSDEAGRNPAWRAALIEKWLLENPPGVGVGWEPYPTSLRIVNWIKAALGGFALPPPAIESLAVQTRWLSAHIEWRLLGNHLLANAKALMFAGLWFDGEEADLWLAQGLHILAEQLPEQVLSDGGHFERSPMYHTIILEDLLDLLNLSRAHGAAERPIIAALPDRIAAMHRWLRVMTHPDGRISFFNDAAFGVSAEPEPLSDYAERLGLAATAITHGPITELQPSGYVRLQSGDAVALLDVAAIGPDYLPGHAHADTLSFELSLGDKRVIVNGGTSAYGVGPQRQLERSTAAHSTVEIDGENSSEVWAGFRVGRRARVQDLAISHFGDRLTVTAAHDGYSWRPGRPIHRRRWELTPAGLAVADLIEGEAQHATARFHFAPEVTPEAEASGLAGAADLAGGRRIRWRTSAPASLQPDEWRPEFGVRTRAAQLVIHLAGDALETRFEW